MPGVVMGNELLRVRQAARCGGEFAGIDREGGMSGREFCEPGASRWWLRLLRESLVAVPAAHLAPALILISDRAACLWAVGRW